MPVRTAIKVINMEKSADRREAFTKMAGGAKVEWSFFPACTGIVAPLTYDARRASRRSGRPMTASEIGCYASHFKLWEWLLNSDYDQLIVMEDDIVASWPIIERVASVKWSDYGIHVLRLAVSYPFKWKLVMHRILAQHIHLVRIAGVTYSTQSYLVTKEAARILVSKYAAIRSPIDWIVGRYWEHNIINYCLFPSPLFDGDISSTIGGGRHEELSPSLFDRIAYRLWQKWDKIRRIHVELFTIKKYPLGPPIGLNDVFIKSPEQ